MYGVTVKDLWVTGNPEGEEKVIGTEKIFEETLTENFPILVKDINLQIQMKPKQDKLKEKHVEIRHNWTAAENQR